MQHRIVQPGPLLTAQGTLAQRGYATEPLLTYNREQIRVAPWRIKEWDFYQVSNDAYCLQLTIGHVSYAGEVSFRFFEFATGRRYDLAKILLLPFDRMKMPRTAERGDLAYRTRDLVMEFHVFEGGRRLICRTSGRRHPKIDVDVHLAQPDRTSIVMATPFDEDERFFYYNQKINCMPAQGHVEIDGQRYLFTPDSAFGLLDWGRGVWPFKHEWYWGNGSGYVDGKRFGFNIGFGFGNTSAATENILFYDGTAHKLGHVHFDLAGSGGYMAKKRFTSDDGRFEMEFTPIYDRYTETKLLFVHTRCHQVFGRFTGRAVLDDGRVLEVKDLVAFAEHAVNRW